MITLAWYLLKVIICSGILCGYYYLALRNNIFHRWNRFYLLASIVLSLTVPLMTINVFHKSDPADGTVVKMLQTISSGDEIVIEYSRNSDITFNRENIIALTYAVGISLFLSIFILTLFRIKRLKKKYPETKIEGINLVATDAEGTPFSFLNSIFWNNSIDIFSKKGQQIFNHEIVHVREKHSWDKVFLNVVLAFFWINPFFWLTQKELGMIHEFIADKEALEDEDVNAFAEMILHTVYPGKQFSIANNFFHSPLKRRLTMFTKSKNPKVTYLSRLLVLPVAAIVFMAFTIKMKTMHNLNKYDGKVITVIIDPGHGGDDAGAMENNVNEKDLNLAIAKEIKRLNKNENINIVLSRETDINKSPKDRVAFAEKMNASLFISVHVDAEQIKNTHEGLVIFIPKDDNTFLMESKMLGSALIESFTNNYPLQVSKELQQREQGIWVLKANPCPSVLLETGFISTEKDLKFLSTASNHQLVAENILNAIEKYATLNANNFSKAATSDTVPQITSTHESEQTSEPLYVLDGKIATAEKAKTIDPKKIERINVTKGEGAKTLYGEKGKNGVVEIRRNSGAVRANVSTTITSDPIYLVDGNEISKDEMKTILPESIESVNVIKGKLAQEKYGEKGKNGAIEITKKAGNGS